MTSVRSNKTIKNTFAIYMVVAMLFMNFPLSAFAQSALAVDIKANASDGPITITTAETYTYSWNSTGAATCEMTAPISSGITLDGSDGPIGSGHPWFPAVGGSVTLTLNCTDGTTNVSDSVVINVVDVAAPAPAVVTADIKANASDGPVVLNTGETYTYTWNSTGANTCEITSPSPVSGITLDGSDGPIGAGHSWYPTAGSSVTLTLNCVNGSVTATDSVVISLADVSNPPVTPLPVVDIKANASDGPVVLSSGQTYTYTWNSSNADSCVLASPSPTSGIILDGSDGPIGAGHPWYPTAGSSVTLTFTCVNSAGSATDSVVISLADVSNPPATPLPTVDIKANASDGPVVLSAGETYTYTWNSSNADTCQLASPSPTSGIILDGSDGPIGPGHPWYPTAGNPVTLTITCVNGAGSATDSVVISVAGITVSGNPPTVDIKANASDGPVTINVNDTYTYTWNSDNADVCQITTPSNSGVILDGSDGPIGNGHPWFPAVGGSVTITIVCSNAFGTATDAVTILVVDNNNGGGNGGGGSSNNGNGGGRHRNGRHRSQPTDETATCLFIKDYMRKDFQNDPIEVMKLQAFLIHFEGHSYVTINGVYDDATITAVNAFQTKYKSDILTPWGHTAPTSYTYILTLKKANEIICRQMLPLSEAQAQEIVAFRALLNSLASRGYDVSAYRTTQTVSKEGGVVSKEGVAQGTATSTYIEIPTGSKNVSKGQINTNDRDYSGFAAALFTMPHSVLDTFQCLYEFLLVLVVLYILASVLKDVFYKDVPENVRKKFFTKWIIIAVGIVVAMIVATKLGETCLLLPLLIALILALIWMFTYPNHGGVRSSVKSWYLVTTARGKTILKEGESKIVSVIEDKKN